jgi:Cytochrome c554 and c-prime
MLTASPGESLLVGRSPQGMEASRRKVKDFPHIRRQSRRWRLVLLDSRCPSLFTFTFFRGPFLILSCLLGLGLPFATSSETPAPESEPFVGSDQCAACHPAIAQIQRTSDHAVSVRKLEEIPDFLKTLPLRYVDKDNAVEYRFQQSAPGKVDMLATKAGQSDQIELLWAFGAGRKALTFVGRTTDGIYGQVRVSWYAASQELDITPGSKTKLKDATDGLADWFETGKREECFRCHVSRQAEAPPETISKESVGIQCERCHGPGRKHIEAVTRVQRPESLAIVHPGRLMDQEQYRFCGECHRQPPADFDSEAFDKIIRDKTSIRYPARRLVLSRCYNEGEGRLKCTLCHNPHGQLAVAADYDAKCLSCHRTKTKPSPCPVSRSNCVSCHMPRGSLTKHLDFADHWIRVVR